MNIAFYGSSLLSSYWNGAATYYRGLLRALAAYGHAITFYEPDAYDRQSHRDMEEPAWARSVVYPATRDGLHRTIEQARHADIVVKASGVGVFDNELVEGLLAVARPGATRIFWDVDAPATLASLRDDPTQSLARAVPSFDWIMTYGGGPPIVRAYHKAGAQRCVPIYNALEPDTHYPVAPDPDLIGDLTLLANRLPDRERRIETYFFEPSSRLPKHRFILGGAGWEDKPMPANVRRLGHIPTARHNALNCSARAVLNVARDSMAEIGFSPATRVFEAAGAGACLITDAWEGVEQFLEPGREILVARTGAEVAGHLASLTPARAGAIGAAARRRCLAQHTYAQRAAQVHALLTGAIAATAEQAA